MSFRKEEKLKIHKNRITDLLSWVYDNGGTELYRPRIVSSTYFDNDNLTMFKDSEEGSIPRKKIRVRSYNQEKHNQESSSLEIKTSSIEGRHKTTSRDFNIKKILSLGFFDHDYGICKPQVRVTYKRSYYKVLNIRLTIDQNIEYTFVKNGLDSPHRVLDTEIAVELKAPNNVSTEYLNHHFPYERIRFSKYSRAINCLTQNNSVIY